MSHHQLKFGYELSKSMGNTTTNTTKMAGLMPILKLAKSRMERLLPSAANLNFGLKIPTLGVL